MCKEEGKSTTGENEARPTHPTVWLFCGDVSLCPEAGKHGGGERIRTAASQFCSMSKAHYDRLRLMGIVYYDPSVCQGVLPLFVVIECDGVVPVIVTKTVTEP